MHGAHALACGLPPLLLALLTGCGSASWVDPCEGNATVGSVLNHTVLDEVLRAHVQQGEINGIKSTLVDYNSLRQDPSRLREYLGQLCSVDVNQLSPAEALAVLINAYNAIMLAIIVHYDPDHSVKELHQRVPEGSIWRHKFATLGGTKVSLDDVEHGLIRNGGFARRVTAGGRMHAALNCASLSCPDLQPTAFRAATLDAQLTAATRQWLANPRKNPGPDGQSAVVLSKIFDWYFMDFQAAAGSVQAFVNLHTTWHVDVVGSTIYYVPYDWNLNEVGGTGTYSGATRPPPGSVAAGLVALLVLLRPLARP